MEYSFFRLCTHIRYTHTNIHIHLLCTIFVNYGRIVLFDIVNTYTKYSFSRLIVFWAVLNSIVDKNLSPDNIDLLIRQYIWEKVTADYIHSIHT